MENYFNLRSKQYYTKQRAQKYGKDAPAGERYQPYHDIITGRCRQSGTDLDILELGCGTGRYFFYLSRVKKLVGVDISENMLSAARKNLERIPDLVPVTEFVQSSIESFTTPGQFDLVYSIGTLGEFCELTPALLENITRFLKPGGLLFFTVVDAASYVKRPIGFKKKIFRLLMKIFPLRWRIRVDGRGLYDYDFKDLFLTRKQLEQMISGLPFPVQSEINLFRDNWHVHHVVKIVRQ